MQVALKSADIGHPAKPTEFHLLWTNAITDEFERQIETEMELGLTPSMQVERQVGSVAKSQLGFIRFVVEPIVRFMSDYHGVRLWIDQLRVNVQFWENVMQEQLQLAKGSEATPAAPALKTSASASASAPAASASAPAASAPATRA